jgi:hypothetical protein
MKRIELKHNIDISRWKRSFLIFTMLLAVVGPVSAQDDDDASGDAEVTEATTSEDESTDENQKETEKKPGELTSLQ